MYPRIISMMLAFSCLPIIVPAQNYATPGAKEKREGRTEQIFGRGADNLNHKFEIHLTKGNRVLVELTSMKDLPAVMNLDSLFAEVLKDLAPLKDSVQNELLAKKIDFIIDTNGSKRLRIINYPTSGSTFLVKDGDVSSLKIEQDTVRVKGHLKSFTKRLLLYLFPYKMIREQRHWQATFLINDLSQIPQYLNGVLNNTMKRIAEEYIIRSKWTAGKDKKMRMNAVYYPYDETKKAVYTGTRPAITLGLPSALFSLETVRNTFATSASLGLSVGIRKGYKLNNYTLYSETLFVFDRENTGKWLQEGYHFITLKWTSENLKSPQRANGFEVDNTMFFSYLVNGKGNYFEKHSFKVGFPGLRYKALLLMPQLTFNQHPSYGLRMSLGW